MKYCPKCGRTLKERWVSNEERYGDYKIAPYFNTETKEYLYTHEYFCPKRFWGEHFRYVITFDAPIPKEKK